MHTPWHARHRSGVRVEGESPWFDLLPDPGALGNRRLRALGLRGNARTHIPLDAWPKEPPSPARIDAAAFELGVGCLCPPQTERTTITAIARATLRAARAEGVDAFLLAALAYHQSRCEPRSSDSYGIGLTRINLGMHAAHIRDDEYHYGRPRPGGGFTPDSIPLHGHAFSSRALLEPENNLFFAAVFLRMFQIQCPAIDRPFSSAPHRNAVSHVIFGDSVRSALPEAMVLTARRRLLAYYEAQETPPECTSCERALRRQHQRARLRALVTPGIAPNHVSAGPVYGASSTQLASPLDGPPRIVFGVLGDPRDRGTRLHAGIDLVAGEGEPVRAVADGVVISAGVELRRKGLIDLPPERAPSVPLPRMGPRGLFVRIEHDNGLVSIYAHLASYDVSVGDHVRRGQRIGYVGHTGVQISVAHLHFGLFAHDIVVNPLDRLAPYVLSIDRGLDLGQLHERLKQARRAP